MKIKINKKSENYYEFKGISILDIAKYHVEDEMSPTQIQKRYFPNTCPKTINRILKSLGIYTKGYKDSKKCVWCDSELYFMHIKLNLSAEQIYKLSRNGETSCYNIVKKNLQRLKIYHKNNTRWPIDVDEIKKQYKEGKSIQYFIDKFPNGPSKGTYKNMLRKNNLIRKNNNMNRKFKLSESEIIEQYKNGKTIKKLKEEDPNGPSLKQYSKLLKNNGIKIRLATDKKRQPT